MRSPGWFFGVVFGIAAVALLMVGLLVAVPYLGGRPLPDGVFHIGLVAISAAAVVTFAVVFAWSLHRDGA